MGQGRKEVSRWLQAKLVGLGGAGGSVGPEKTERAVIATTDPETLPDATTWYLVTNIPVPGSATAERSSLEAASLQDVVRLYGLRMWIEQSYKHVKHVLGWSEYQVRSDRAIRRHWQLVCCAFSFCCYHASHFCSSKTEDAREASEPPTSQRPEGAVDVTAPGKKISKETGSRPPLSWPIALRAVRGWLEPWIMLRRFWRAWSEQPPPPLLQRLLDQLGRGQALFLYGTF